MVKEGMEDIIDKGYNIHQRPLTHERRYTSAIAMAPGSREYTSSGTTIIMMIILPLQ